jgi:ABC-type amino acid transport substrate-binding protein
MAQQETPPATKPATLPQCATSGVLQVGSDASYPPFETVNETTNKIEGFDVDLLNAMGQRAGFTPNFHNALFDTIFTALSYGQYDLVASASTITEERQKTVSFSNPYFKSGPVIVVRQADASTVKGPADLAGKTIGVQLGTTGAEAAKQIANTKGVKEYPTAPEAYQALANGDVEAVVDDTVPALTIIANRPELKLAVVGEPLGTEYYGIAVRKDCPDLLAKVNQALGEVIADGTYATLYEKYFGEAPSAEFRKGAAGVVSTPAATMSAGETPAATMAATMAATTAK